MQAVADTGVQSAARGSQPAEWGEVARRVEGLLEAPIANLGCRLLEAVYRHEGRWVLRLVIDKPADAAGEGVTLEDCGRVSELAGRILDVEDPIPHAFSLEVTSPGLFRALKERRHFEQSLGKLCRFTLAPGVLPERKERTLRGTVRSVEGDTVVLTLPPAAEGQEEEAVQVPLEAIRGARLDPDL